MNRWYIRETAAEITGIKGITSMESIGEKQKDQEQKEGNTMLSKRARKITLRIISSNGWIFNNNIFL